MAQDLAEGQVVSKERTKGRNWEKAVAIWLTAQGVGAKRYESVCDPRGDLDMDLPFVVECKDVGAFSPGVWTDQAARSAERVGCFGRFIVFAKRRGKASPAHAYAIVPMPFLADLLIAWEHQLKADINVTPPHPFRVDL